MNFFRRVAAPALALVFLLTPLGVTSSAQTSRSAPAAKPGNAEPIDINTATRDQLKALPGIGDAYADRIIKGRPYSAKNQLTQRGVLPAAAYSKIQSMIVARHK